MAGVAAVVCDNRPYPDAVRKMPCSFFSAEEMETIVTKDSGEREGGPDTKKARTSPTTVASAVCPKINELNPLLVGRNTIEERPVASLPDDFFSQFDAIVASRLSVAEATRISLALNKSERMEDKAKVSDNDSGDGKVDIESSRSQLGKLFVITDTFGFDGCAFLDFGHNHTYRRELGKDKLSDLMTIQPYVSMADMFDVPLAKVNGRWDKVVPRILVLQRLLMDYWEHYEKNKGEQQQVQKQEFIKFSKKWLISNSIPTLQLLPSPLSSYDGELSKLEQWADIAYHPEISPVCAVLGGVLGNEVIKALTGKGEPANNVLLFDGLEGGCRSFTLGDGNGEKN